MSKPALRIHVCKNKGADQLLVNPAADKCLCFRYIGSTNSILKAFSHLLWLYSPVCVWTWLETPKTGFFGSAAQFIKTDSRILVKESKSHALSC